MLLHAETIAIGTELTSGEKLDTNSQWLSLALSDVGIPTLFHTTVGDDRAANIQVVRTAIDRADVVIITGGLGPTLDDLTREVLAEVAGTKLELDAVSLSAIETYFRNRGREMPDRNRTQAMFPVGATVLPNPVGTAPGIWMAIPRKDRASCVIAAVPGVPSEMRRMFHDQVRPRLPDTGILIKRARINSYGLGEAQVDEVLGDVTARGRDPEVGITAHQATITLRINARGATESECDAKIAETSRIIRERLGEHVFGVEDEELQHAVINLLKERNQTLAVVESGTEGALTARLAAVDDGEHFRHGTILPRKQWFEHEAAHNGLASANTEGLARWLRASTGCHYVLSVSPYAIPQTMHSDVEVAYVSLDAGGTLVTERVLISGNPQIQQARVVKSALDLLRRHLLANRT